jgi:glycosyltransferase involved in cell wall biosynthesis
VFRSVVSELRSRGQQVDVVPLPSGRVPALTAITAAIRTRRALRAADIVHVEFGSNDLEAFWFALVAALMRNDCVVVAHDYPKLAHVPASGLLPLSSRWARRIAYRVLSPALDGLLRAIVIRRSGIIVVFNNEAREAWLDRGARRVEVISLGTDRGGGSTVPPSEGEFILFAGYISPHKGVDTLLEAWASVGERIEFALIVAGRADPPHDVWSEELQKQYGAIPNPARFLGEVKDDAEFQALIDRSAIVVLPYRFSSPASGVLVRALGAGRPVIATPVPATAAILDGENGLLVPSGDAQRLADALLTLSHSAEERDRLGAAAARTAERFTWGRHVDGLMRAYAAAIEICSARDGDRDAPKTRWHQFRRPRSQRRQPQQVGDASERDRVPGIGSE